MPGRLEGKVAIVTGAAARAPGIGNGSATAILMAREGAKVVLVNRTESRAQELQQTIAAEGGESIVVTGDVTNSDDVQRIVETTVATYGQLNVLVNNVGEGMNRTVEEVTEAEWDALMNHNLKSALLCSKYSIPHMRAAGGGSIINMSSLAGLLGATNVGFAAYSTSKAGMHGLTRATAAENAVHGIRANTIVIGLVHTPIGSWVGEEGRIRRRQAVALQTEGTGWDIGWAAVYLASDEARWVTAIELTVDGGYLNITTVPR